MNRIERRTIDMIDLKRDLMRAQNALRESLNLGDEFGIVAYKKAIKTIVRLIKGI